MKRNALIIFAFCLTVPAMADELWIEAETGKLSGDFKIIETTEASGSKCVEAGRTGSLDIPFTIRRGGTYFVWARHLTANRFKLYMDGKDIDCGRNSVGYGVGLNYWIWAPAYQSTLYTSTHIEVPLAEGAHTLSFRDGWGSLVDKTWITPLRQEYSCMGGSSGRSYITERMLVNCAAAVSLDASAILRGKPYTVGYIYTQVLSPEERKAVLICRRPSRFTGMRAWLNGELVCESLDTPDVSCEAQVRLKAGANGLLIKIGSSTGEGLHGLLIRGEDGLPIKELKYTDGRGSPPEDIPAYSGIGPWKMWMDRSGFFLKLPPEDRVDFKAEYVNEEGETIGWKDVPLGVDRELLRDSLTFYSSAEWNSWGDLRPYEKAYTIATGKWINEMVDKWLSKPLFSENFKRTDYSGSPFISLYEFPGSGSLGTPVKTYYVSDKGGDDSNPGTRERPWATLEKAAEALRAGEEVVVREGIYGGCSLRESGKEGSYITYRAAKNEEVWVTGGFSIGGTVSYIHIKGFHIGLPVEVEEKVQQPEQSNLNVGEEQSLTPDGLQVEALNLEDRRDVRGELLKRKLEGGGGVSISGRANHIFVEDCEISRTGRGGVGINTGEYLYLKGLHIHHVGGSGIGLGSKLGSYGPHGVLIDSCRLEYGGEGNTDGVIAEYYSLGVVIRNCTSSHFGDAGFDIKPEDTVLENCVAGGGCGEGFKLWRSAKLVNCLSYGNGREIQLAGIGNKRGVELVNCTIVAKGNALEADGPVHIINCVMVGRVSHAEGLEENFNLFSGGAEVIKQGPRSLTGDPKFADPTKGDYHLQNGSFAIDAGTTSAPKTDLEGKARLQGKGVDIGAYEWTEGNK